MPIDTSKQFEIIKYPDDYREACFYAWYQAGRPVTDIMKHIPTAPDGRRPDMATIRLWMKGAEGREDWHQHADRLDAEVSVKLDKQAIEERARVLKKLASDGRKLKEAGIQFLEREDPFKDNPSAAVRAIIAGGDMEAKYTGMAESLIQISTMTPKQLEKEMFRLLGKNENENVIDAEVQEDAEPDTDS